MVILVVALLSLGIGLLRGGRLIRLAVVPLRYAYLVLVSLGLQLVLFSPLAVSLRLEAWVPLLYVVSMVILVLWFVLNFRLPGMALIGLGLVLNLSAIVANGGYMPASPDALQRAGMASRLADAQQAIHNNSILATDQTRLYFLTDVFAIPKGLPLANVFSIGDVFIALGAAYFLQRVLTDARYDPPNTSG